MNKIEFIRNIINRFAYYIQGEQSQQVMYDIYSRVLTKKIDYEKLWNLFCNEYASKTPPTGVELKNLARQCYLQDNSNSNAKWLQVKIFNPITKSVISKDCFPKGTTKEQILKTYEKMFNRNDFEIVEIY